MWGLLTKVNRTLFRLCKTDVTISWYNRRWMMTAFSDWICTVLIDGLSSRINVLLLCGTVSPQIQLESATRRIPTKSDRPLPVRGLPLGNGLISGVWFRSFRHFQGSLESSEWVASEARTSCRRKTWTSWNRTQGTMRPQSRSGTKGSR